MKILSFRVAFLLIVFMLAGTSAYAHRVSIFAYVEGNKIFTESYFSKSKRVHQGKVEVFSTADDKLLLSGVTDDDGKFDFAIPEEAEKTKCGLHLVLHASEGHRGEWTLAPDELYPASEAAEESVEPASQSEASSSGSSASKAQSSISSTELSELNSRLKELNAKVDTVKHLLIEQQEKGPGFHEIISGIGYILGLFGIAAFFSSRKRA
ncbi:hypothetical protein [Maridesulfovibrio sp.]|uniref:hypothetical protein n=1 Tax=Maridesulfovibrio sp. TaxID=2795000 RepID=UPI002A18D470|nr:hypothetical protein [Maridesulfovibrio sp.]